MFMHSHNSYSAEMWPIDKVIPYDRNPRVIPKEAILQVAASISGFGWQQPIVVDEAGVILVGHTRRLAALHLGHSSVPVHVAAGLSAAKARAYRLADNRVAEATAWDFDELRSEIGMLAELDFSMDALGFSPEEITRLFEGFDQVNNADDDDLSSLRPEPVTRLGDLWKLGRHRLLCGDATNASDVGRLLNGASPTLMVTDPPYGVEYDPSWRHRAGMSSSERTGVVANDDRADWRSAWELFPGDVAYVWHAGLQGATVAESLHASRFSVRAQIIWAKPHLVIGRGHYHWQHEPCFYAVRTGKTGRWQGSRKQTTLWEIGTGDQDAATFHGTQKPVECMRRPIMNSSRKGDGIYEPFAGSGSTIIAAERTGRSCFAMELDPAYCDLIVERWRQATGLAAELERSDSQQAYLTKS
jgi:DNA modification methylase